jgi:2-polyprenyl-3-methyl-5-hydroxy-6-metoxy-1,4-benzoquinol methylase
MRHLRPTLEGRRVLDVGCGNGTFLLDMRAAGWEVHGLDVDPDAVAAARAAGVPAELGFLEDSTLKRESFTAVTLNHVIEHIHDPHAALRMCHDLLLPTGVLWIATPNFDSTSHREFGRHWRGLEPPRHLVLYRSSSLDHILTQAGFTVVARPRYCGATAMFQESASIARWASSNAGSARSFRGTTPRAFAANIRAFVSPAHAEELIVVAKKRRRHR